MPRKFAHIHSFVWQAVCVAMLVGALLLSACSVKNNTASTRFYHNLTTRYNVYYNGNEAFIQSYKQQLESQKENYQDLLRIEPITAKVDVNKESGGSFDVSLQKGRKAIREHSIRSKPKGRNVRNTPFYKKREYNTFIYHAWLLVGKSQFYNGDFLDAMATFSYMGRLYKEEPNISSLAKLWQARCYIALQWEPDAQKLIGEVTLTDKLQHSELYGKTTAELALAKGQYAEAFEKLKIAIKKEKNKLARQRLRYLLAQLYAETHQTHLAEQTFAKVVRSAPPFGMELAARLHIISLKAERAPQQSVRQLDKMMRDGRYAKVVDHIAYTEGVLLLQQRDTTQAVKVFLEGCEKSHEKGYYLAKCNIELAQIYLQRRDYVKAAEALAAAMSKLSESDKEFDTYHTLSEKLDELAKHAKVVNEQDSLQHLAALPEAQQNRIIDSAITAYKKRIKEEKRAEAMQQQREQQEQANAEMDAYGVQREQPQLPVNEQITDKNFYFYNQQLIERGKKQFAQRWGNRPNEDNWRRRNKKNDFSAPSMMSEPPTQQADSSALQGAGGTLGAGAADSLHRASSDLEKEANGKGEQEKKALPDDQNPEKRAYYLASLPTTPEKKAESDKLIQTGLQGMGEVLNTQMERFQEAVDVYEDLLRRYPEYKERLQVYYNLYMLAERMGNKERAAYWRQMMKTQFPAEALTKEVSQKNYIAHLRAQDSIAGTLYANALNDYRSGKAGAAITLIDTLLSQYQLSPVRAQALFVKALCFVAEGKQEQFKATLQQLLEEKSSGDVADIAQQMLAELLAGRHIVQGGYSGLNFDALYLKTDSAAQQDSLFFTKPQYGEPYNALLIYSEKSVDRNELLFAITAFNFSHFTERLIPISETKGAEFQMITLTDLGDIANARKYMREAYGPEGFMRIMDSTALLIPVSNHNLKCLHQGASVGSYMEYMADSLIVFFPESAIPLERFVKLAEEHDKQAEAQKHKEADAKVAASTHPQKSVAPPRKQEADKQQKEAPPAHAKSTPPTKQPAADSVKRVADSVAHATPPLTKVADTLQQSPSQPKQVLQPDTVQQQAPDSVTHDADYVAPGTLTYEQVQEQRKERIAADKERAKKEEQLRKEQEKARKEALREREKARREREKARREEREQREKERKEAQKERERERKKALEERKKALEQRQAELRERQKERERAQQQREKERKERTNRR